MSIQLSPLPWQYKKYVPILRQWEITSVLGRFLLYLVWDKIVGNNSGKRRQIRAKWLVERMMLLGPTFIKIGQSLSTRADLIPIEYVERFATLQDRVPPFSTEKAVEVIESELGQPITALFEEFDRTPLACASLGQVHRAKLTSGEEVVIKVQRPGLEKLFNLDFELLHTLTRFLNRFSAIKKYNLEAVYTEFFAILFQEIDYIHEGKNADRFRVNFKDYPLVKVPLIYWQYTTKKVLTLEYMPGIKVDDRETLAANGINLDKVIETGICSYLKQLLQDGFFQSDPHPGNMAVNLSGELIFYDFGTMTEVKSVAQEQMINTFFAVLRKDTDEVLRTLVYMGLLEPVSDMKPVRKIVQFLLDEFRDKPVDIKAFERISDEVYAMFQQQPFRLPPQMTFIIKSVTTLDGIARALDPQYNLLAASQPFVKNLALSKAKGTTIVTLAKGARDFFVKQLKGNNRNGQIVQRLEQKIEDGELSFRVRSFESERILKRIYLGIKCLIYSFLTGFSVLAGIGLLSTIYSQLHIVAFGLAGLFSLFLLRALVALLWRERLDRIIEK
ncbi:MAG: putative protein kinase UbiB [Chroococcopsis gigantea SAG 12.99]|jgi:predicted unusual protein kinase regulating ubiquinone biosynthesis (AarF/ABC1/UbiB family)|nr:putative protein kinase UbiB [Chroococcopsis gigantea SAG 12.99]